MEIAIIPGQYNRFLGRYNRFFVLPVTAIIVTVFFGCTARMIQRDQQLLGEADSLFRAGNYEFAKLRFDKIRTFKPQSSAARIAQYYLGYINVYYDNPFASWDAALREFKQFVTLYPDDPRVGEVHTWIKLLTAMQSNERRYLGTTDSIVALNKQKRLSDLAVKNSVSVDSIETLFDSNKRCVFVRDSLAKENMKLENLIIDLVKKCTEAAGQ